MLWGPAPASRTSLDLVVFSGRAAGQVRSAGRLLDVAAERDGVHAERGRRGRRHGEHRWEDGQHRGRLVSWGGGGNFTFTEGVPTKTTTMGRSVQILGSASCGGGGGLASFSHNPPADLLTTMVAPSERCRRWQVVAAIRTPWVLSGCDTVFCFFYIRISAASHTHLSGTHQETQPHTQRAVAQGFEPASPGTQSQVHQLIQNT